eukprot:comp22436_c0_seq1/m.33683 comp22436_c0_seq1/g.33683  ORF comp22436_c0_seq1/g.33683 comp22436_c0_seq1/m.33683 type:complete len:344 (-) comp22436_c0_seq1:94-1125(-)
MVASLYVFFTALAVPIVAYAFTRALAPPPDPSALYTSVRGAAVVSSKERDDRGSWWRRIVKYILHKVTGKCELQRLCEGPALSPEVYWEVEWSLRRSHQLAELYRNITKGQTFSAANAVKAITSAKNLQTTNVFMLANLTQCLDKRFQIAQIYVQVDRLSKEIYDSSNKSHEGRLEQLWSALVQDETLPGRKGAHWDRLGFQGHDPATDFRGMGILSLDNMLYFAQKYPTTALSLLGTARHPKHGHQFAVTCINLTAMAVSLLQSGALHCHFYGLGGNQSDFSDFQDVFCWLLVGFCWLWEREGPENIMAYPKIRAMFEKEVLLPNLDKTPYGKLLILPADTE